MSDNDFDFADFFEELNEGSGERTYFGDFCRVRLDPAYAAFVSGDVQVFSVIDSGGKAEAKALAAEHLRANGYSSKGNNRRSPAVCMRLRIYKDSFINEKNTKNWRDDHWDDTFSRSVYKDEEGNWHSTPGWLETMKTWYLLADDGETNIAPIQAKDYGHDLWAHVDRVRHPDFVKGLPLDEQRYGTAYEDKESGEVRANTINVVRAAFKTKSQLLAYMKENGYEVETQEASGEEKIDFSNVDPAAVATSVTPPDNWEEKDYTAQVWTDCVSDIVKSLKKGAAPTAIFLQWRDTFSREKFDEIVAAAQEGSAF